MRTTVPAARSVLVAITGIDGCGKGYLAAQLGRALEEAGPRVAIVNIDGWLNLPRTRFSPKHPAAHFYRHAIRFDELFEQLVLPLRERRSLRVVADVAEETATTYRRHVYEFSDVDVILLEGIYLLKRAFAERYDLSIWIDCSFETALERAIARSQEGLSADHTVHAYRSIDFPAQEIHFACDNPAAAATMRVNNDPRLAGGSTLFPTPDDRTTPARGS